MVELSVGARAERLILAGLTLGLAACSSGESAAHGASGDRDAGSEAGAQTDLPKGLPAFCEEYAACCYATLDKDTCDALLDGIAQAAEVLPLADQRELCSGCMRPETCSDSDALTASSLAQAKAELAQGADHARVTPYGCVQYDRTTLDGATTSENLRFGSGSKSVFEATYAEREATVSLRVDGQLSLQASAEADGDGNLSALTLEAYTQAGDIEWRDVYTRASDDALGVQSERRTRDGSLNALDAFEAPLAQAAFGPQPKEVTTQGCSAEQAGELEALLADVVVEGFHCMEDKQRNDIAMFVLANYLTRKITFNCEAKGDDPLIAQIAILARFTSWLFGEFSIAINTDRFFATDAQGARSLSENVRKNVLFHELLHLYFGAHQPSAEGDRLTEYDPTYACAGTCFELDAKPPKATTKCACATCLNTDVCDPRCAGFADCDPDMGAGCNALPPKWFASAMECETSCTGHCDVHDVSCDPCN